MVDLMNKFNICPRLEALYLIGIAQLEPDAYEATASPGHQWIRSSGFIRTYYEHCSRARASRSKVSSQEASTLEGRKPLYLQASL